ncbi:uncharacterized protein [Diadema setosum]|uniref:uncharacterized protein n=1 Tax=Diadema setosum TaxID=31175 RepID=UPI003B3B6980
MQERTKSKTTEEVQEINLGLKCQKFSYGDFNKAGTIDLWKIAKAFESGRSAALFQGLKDGIQIDSRIGLFVRFQQIDLSETFHSMVNATAVWDMPVRVSYVGKTSLCMDNAIICQSSRIELGRSVCQAVRVDRATRRPVPLPQEVATTYQKTATRSGHPQFDFPAMIPGREFTYTISTRAFPSDTDSNQHVNQSLSFKYCMDCASVAAMEGNVFSGFSTDVAYYLIKTFAVEYVGEMRVGDNIDIVCWEDQDDPCSLWFLVKVEERVVSRCKGEWYADSNRKPVKQTRPRPILWHKPASNL